jgi:tetratricopeptide (TPR) repeat protein
MAYYHYWGKRDYEPALAELAIAQRSMPDDPEVLVADFAIKRRQRRLQEALTSAQRAFDLSPREDDLPREIGNIYMMMGEVGKARAAYEQSIALAPDQQAAYTFVALSYWSEGDLEKGNAALERIPRTPSAFLTYSLAYSARMNRDWAALLRLAESSAFDVLETPDSWLPMDFLRSLAYRQMGDTVNAGHHLREAIALAEGQLAQIPGDHRLHKTLGLMYAQQRRREEAIDHGRRALELYPPDRDALHGPGQLEGMAWILIELGEFDAAVEYLERFLTYPTWFTSEWMELDAFYDPLREHPGFQRLLEKHRRRTTRESAG